MGIQNNFHRPDVRHMPIISALGRLKQDHEFEANLGCINVTLSNTQHTPKRQNKKPVSHLANMTVILDLSPLVLIARVLWFKIAIESGLALVHGLTVSLHTFGRRVPCVLSIFSPSLLPSTPFIDAAVVVVGGEIPIGHSLWSLLASWGITLPRPLSPVFLLVDIDSGG